MGTLTNGQTIEPSMRQLAGDDCATCGTGLGGAAAVDLGLREVRTGVIWVLRVCQRCGREAARVVFLDRVRSEAGG